MTRDQLLQMALGAGGRMYASDEVEFFLPDLERFAKSVYESAFRDANIAASRTIIDAAVLHEREACAKVCEANAEACNNNSMLRDVLAGNAAAIRARSYT